jgi:dATP pyrophosphohydrolase
MDKKMSASHTLTYKQPISVLVVIYTADLQVLLLKRTDFSEAWQSVTGSVEGDETLRQTAIREIKEETGIDAEQYQLLDWAFSSEYEIYEYWRYRYAPGVKENTEHVFGLKLPHSVSIDLSENEHVAYCWVAWQIAAEMVFSPSNGDAIRMLPKKEHH